MPKGYSKHNQSGWKHSEKAKKKLSESRIGKRNSPQTEFKKNHIPWNAKGSKRNEILGSKNPNWKGGVPVYLKVYRRRIRKAGCGGSHTEKEWNTMKYMYNSTCPHCQRKEPEIKLTKDHIIPITKKGSDYIWNIMPLCRSCNSKKYNKFESLKYRSDVFWNNFQFELQRICQ